MGKMRPMWLGGKNREWKRRRYMNPFSLSLTIFLFLNFLFSFEEVFLFVFLVLGLGEMKGKRVTLHELWWK